MINTAPMVQTTHLGAKRHDLRTDRGGSVLLRLRAPEDADLTGYTAELKLYTSTTLLLVIAGDITLPSPPTTTRAQLDFFISSADMALLPYNVPANYIISWSDTDGNARGLVKGSITQEQPTI